MSSNTLECPVCGRVRVETPPGTTALPTIGMARKASGAAGQCECGQAPHERPEVISHTPGEPGGPGTAATDAEGARDADDVA
jgi:hypothetical protein